MTSTTTPLIKVSSKQLDPIWCCSWCCFDENLFATSADSIVKLWKYTAANPENSDSSDNVSLVNTFDDQGLAVVSVVHHPTDATMLTSSMDSKIRVYDVSQSKLLKTINAGPIECWKLSIHPDGNTVATGTHNGGVNIWDIDSARLSSTLQTGGNFIMSVEYSPDGKLLACGASDGAVYIFDLIAGRLSHTIPGHILPVRSLSFSPDSSTLYAASDAFNTYIYDAAHGNESGALVGHLSWVLAVAASPSGKYVTTSSSDKKLKVWDVETNLCVDTHECHSDQVFDVAYNRDGSRLLSVGGDGNIQLYSQTL